jgi:antitoxin CcdA
MRIHGNMNAFVLLGPQMSTTSSSLAGAARKATNISLGATLLSEAKSLSINISQAAEAGIARAVAEKHAELWLEANQAALESSNAYVEKNGLPLARYRGF